jgi:hypothetical protein
MVMAMPMRKFDLVMVSLLLESLIVFIGVILESVREWCSCFPYGRTPVDSAEYPVDVIFRVSENGPAVFRLVELWWIPLNIRWMWFAERRIQQAAERIAACWMRHKSP